MFYTLNLTKNCNFDCKYCSDIKEDKKITEEIAMKALVLAAATKNGGFSFFGGEPLLEEELIRKIVLEAKKYKNNVFSYKVTTNGSLLTQSFMQFSNENNIEVALSHDGISQDINRVFKNKEQTKQILEDKIDLLLRYQPNAIAMLTYSKETIKDLSSSVKWLYERGFKEVCTTMDCRKEIEWDLITLTQLQKQYGMITDILLDYYRSNRNINFTEFDYKIYEFISKTNKLDNCKLGKKQPSIDIDGLIYPCVQFVGKPYYIIGNVYTGIDITKQQKIYEESKKSLNYECKKCVLNKRCRNNCACLNYSQTGNLNIVSDAQCYHEQIIIRNADYLASQLFKEKNAIFLNKFY